jgi:hypothetical protein
MLELSFQPAHKGRRQVRQEVKLSETSHRRASFENKRIVRQEIAARAVADAVGPITRGIEVYGISKGQFSLIDLITYCLEATGPADVVISTWTAANADLKFAYTLMTAGTIRSLRFLVDFSFPSRQPAYCAALRETFGDDCIRISKNHAKFVTVRNDQWNLVIRTSMNLNENRRLESFEISDDKNMAAFLDDVIRDLFETQPAAGQFNRRPIDHIRQFEAFREQLQEQMDSAMQSTDVKKFYDPSPFGNDLRRTGLTFTGGKKK